MDASLALAQACVPATFGTPTLFGARVLSIEASLVTNFTASVPAAYRFTQPSIEVQAATFCNVTVTYTHPGQDDEVHVEAWLPVGNPGWNGRLQATGGGSWAAGRFALGYQTMTGAIGDGYAATATDAGLSTDPYLGAGEWALLSPGNVNLHKLNNFGSVSLNDQAILGKAVTRSFYGKKPKYSYWNGCSQGGRQGIMLAQRYPNAYDGIAAGAPALYWPELFAGLQWPQQVMNVLGSYPYGCELDEIAAAAISACDTLDGVVDGIVTEVDACLDKFDPFTLVNKTIDCPQAQAPIRITRAAALLTQAVWRGPRTADDRRLWYGLNPGVDLTGNNPIYNTAGPGVAYTNCTTGTCVGVPDSPWFQLFIAKDAEFDMGNLTNAEFAAMAHAGRQQYGSILATDDADLSWFRDAGGKMISFHGLADQIIPPKGTEHYYQAVSAAMGSDVDSFYRHYEVPGLGHCFGGRGGSPTSLFEQLRAWVENGTASESSPFDVTGLDGETQNRILCPYPQTAELDTTCGGPANAACWACV